MTANARRKEILRILYGRQNMLTTARYLAEHFEVTEKTIYRDIDALVSDEHEPLDILQGRGGGIRYNGVRKYGRILSMIQVDALKRAIENNPNDADILQGIIDTLG